MGTILRVQGGWKKHCDQYSCDDDCGDDGEQDGAYSTESLVRVSRRRCLRPDNSYERSTFVGHCKLLMSALRGHEIEYEGLIEKEGKVWCVFDVEKVEELS
jgi:hypothetical protein